MGCSSRSLAGPRKRFQSSWPASGVLSSSCATFQFHIGFTSVILPRIPLSTSCFALMMDSALRRCMPICTICLVLRTASTICRLCSSECDMGFSRYTSLRASSAASRHGAIRQMMLGFHYMDYYHNAYAQNQYLASRGYAVLSVNYRLGIMYGREFREAPNTVWRGAAEYKDVVAAGKYLQSL